MLTLGLIGAGQVVRDRHAHILAEWFAAQLEVIGVATTRPERAELIAKTLGYAVPRYTDYRELLDQRPEVVLVAVPPGRTAQICTETLARGTATYSEKPMASSHVGALNLARLAARTGTPYLVGENFSFQERFVIGEHWVSQAGRPDRISVDDRLRRGDRDTVRTDLELCWEHVCHPLNAARRLLGRPIAQTSLTAAFTEGESVSRLLITGIGDAGEHNVIDLRITDPWSRDNYTVEFAGQPPLRISHRFDFETSTYTDRLDLDAQQLDLRLAECGIRSCWNAITAALTTGDRAVVDETVALGVEQAALMELAKLSVRHDGRPVPVEL